MGGRVADRSDRASVLACTFLGGGLAAALAFTLPFSPWLTVVFAFAVSGLLLLAWPVAAVMLTDLAGNIARHCNGALCGKQSNGDTGWCFVGWGHALVLDIFL